MEIHQLPLTDIRVPDDHRALNEGAVAGLVKSFEDIGQQTPITYYDDDGEMVLISGRHRLEAARRLELDTIDGIEMDVDPLTRELWGIDENLMRADLTDLERADHTARRAEIVKQRAEIVIPQNEEKVAHRPSKGQVDFVKETAAKTGKSKASVERDKRRGEKITPEVKKAIKDMPAASKGVELDALASMAPKEQAQAVKQVKSGASKDFREAKKAIKGKAPTDTGGKKAVTVADVEFNNLRMVWRRSSVTARKRFLAWVNEQHQGKASMQ